MPFEKYTMLHLVYFWDGSSERGSSGCGRVLPGVPRVSYLSETWEWESREDLQREFNVGGNSSKSPASATDKTGIELAQEPQFSTGMLLIFQQELRAVKN